MKLPAWPWLRFFSQVLKKVIRNNKATSVDDKTVTLSPLQLQEQGPVGHLDLAEVVEVWDPGL